MVVGIIAVVWVAILGGLMLLWPQGMVRFQVWTQRVIMHAQYVPSARTYLVMRILGALVLLIGLASLYAVLTQQ